MCVRASIVIPPISSSTAALRFAACLPIAAALPAPPPVVVVGLTLPIL